MPEPKTLHIVDHQGGRSRRLAAVLTSLGLRVEAWSDGEALLASLDPGQAGCVLVEQDTSGSAAIEIERKLRLRGLAIPVIAIDGGSGLEAASAALRACQGEDSGTARVPPTVPAASLEQEVLRDRFARLTPCEREVAQLVAQGHSSKEVARLLHLSKSTVDNHRAHVLEKLGLANSVQLTRFLSLLE